MDTNQLKNFLMAEHEIWKWNRCCGGSFSLLGQGPVSIVEFFVDPKNGTLETNKPPAMQVSQYCFSLQKKTSSDTIMLVRQPH